MKKIAILYSQHIKVAKVLPDEIDEIVCCIGCPGAEDLLLIRTIDGQKFYADEIQFDILSTETPGFEFQHLFWKLAKTAYEKGRSDCGTDKDIDIEALWKEFGEDMLSLKTIMTWSKL